MSLQALEWRKLPVRIATASYTPSILLNTLADMLTGSTYIDGTTRTVSSGSAWSASLRFITGSNTEALVCRPPFNTVISQSVIFSTRTTVAPSSSVSLASIPVGPSEQQYTCSAIHVAQVKNATGSFTQWTSQFPFGSSSYSSGYALAFNGGFFVSASKIVIFESKEAIAVYLTVAFGASPSIVIAGALIDPETDFSSTTPISRSEFNGSDCEIDGRIYGVTTAGCLYGGAALNVAPLSTAFWVNNYNSISPGSLFSTNIAGSTATNGFGKFHIITPNENNRNTCNIDVMGSAAAGLNYYISSSLTRSGSLVQHSFYCYDPINLKFLGRLRDMTAIRPQASNVTVKNPSGTTIGYTVSASETTGSGVTNNTLLFNYS